MFGRLVRRLVLVALAVGLAFLATREGAPGAVVAWSLLGYVLWRAFPAMRADFHTLTAFLPRGGSTLRRTSARSGDL